MAECIPISLEEFGIGRMCIVCKKGFNLYNELDRRLICDDCCRAVVELNQNSKRNWVAGSKGGEPNCRR